MANKVRFSGKVRMTESRKSGKGSAKQRAARHANAKKGSLQSVSNAPIPY